MARCLSRFVLSNNVSMNRLPFIKTVCCRCFSGSSQFRNDNNVPVLQQLLDILVCPLSKKPLRHDSATNELISDEIGVAFPIQNGIPNLVPHDGRLLEKDGTNVSKEK